MKNNNLKLHIDSVVPKNPPRQQENFLICPHFREWHSALCIAGDIGVVLMPFMKIKYCTSENFHNCPFWEFTEGITDQSIAEENTP